MPGNMPACGNPGKWGAMEVGGKLNSSLTLPLTAGLELPFCEVTMEGARDDGGGLGLDELLAMMLTLPGLPLAMACM